MVNDSVSRAIEGSVRFPLPDGASVVRYAFEIDGAMVDALALPNRKAAEVAYKEREAGRNVSKTEKVEGNLFETTIFPLEYNVERKLIISYMAPLTRSAETSAWGVSAPFRFEKPARVSATVKVYPEEPYTATHNLTSEATTQLPEGFAVSVVKKAADQKEIPDVTFGTYLDKAHFSTFVSREYVKEVFGPITDTVASGEASKHICVLWDVSQSCKSPQDQAKYLKFFTDLEEAHKKRNETVKFTVTAFSTDLNTVAKEVSAENAISAINNVAYDGGTNLAVLGEVFKAQLKKDTNFSSFVLCTDGVDNIGDGTRIPEGLSPEFGTPVHVLVPQNQTVNENLLRCITSQTHAHYGTLSEASARIIAKVDEDFAVTGIMPVIDGQSDETLLLDLLQDENFVTVPDWRLPDQSWWPLRETGVLVSGTLPSNTKATPNAFEFTFYSTARGKKTVRIPFSLETGVHSGEVGRLIGILHCQNVIEESRAIQIDPDFSRNFIETIATQYNITSDYTSLLLLHSAVQFVDNDIDCPESHPQHSLWKSLKAQKETSVEIQKLKREIARLDKLSKIQFLGSRLVDYYTQSFSLMEEEELHINELKAKVEANTQVSSEIASVCSTAETKLTSVWSVIIDPLAKEVQALKDVKNTLTQEQSSLKQKRESFAKGIEAIDKLNAKATERISEISQKLESDLTEKANAVVKDASERRQAAINQIIQKKTNFLSHLQSMLDRDRAALDAALKSHTLQVEEARQHLRITTSESAKSRQKFVDEIARIEREAREAKEAAAKKEREAQAKKEKAAKDKKEKKEKEKKEKKKSKKEESCAEADGGASSAASDNECDECEEEECRERAECEAEPMMEALCDRSSSLDMECLQPPSSLSRCAEMPCPTSSFSSERCRGPVMKKCMASKPMSQKLKCEEEFAPAPKLEDPVEVFTKFVDPLLVRLKGTENTLVASQERLRAALAEVDFDRVTKDSDAVLANYSDNFFEGKIKIGFDLAVAKKKEDRLRETNTRRVQLKEENKREEKIRKSSAETSRAPYLAPIRDLLLQSKVEEAYATYLAEREKGDNSKSPSFYIYSSRLFHSAECDKSISTKIITNTLEMNIQDVQMFRSVAYFMLEIGSTDEAITIFRRVQDKAPGEPHSFMDLGMALYFDARQRHIKKTISDADLEKQLKEAINQIATVICGTWPDRFAEIEWPALIWINWMAGFALHALGVDLWPEARVERCFQIHNMCFDLVVAMNWDTDWTDIDLHVHEPDGAHVYYASNSSPSGGHISRDFRQGYGPEVYVTKRALAGFYDVHAQYFSSHQASSLTGTTSCCLWSVKWMGHFDKEEFDFRMVRLDTNSTNIRVMTLDLVR